jgi:hypothetical protein
MLQIVDRVKWLERAALQPINDFLFFFVGDALLGSAGCFKKATQTPNAGHPIWCNIQKVHDGSHKR